MCICVSGVNESSAPDRCRLCHRERGLSPLSRMRTIKKSDGLSALRSSAAGRSRVNNIESISRLWRMLLMLSQYFYRSRSTLFSKTYKKKKAGTIFWPKFKHQCSWVQGTPPKKTPTSFTGLIVCNANSVDLLGNLMQIVLQLVNSHMLY